MASETPATTKADTQAMADKYTTGNKIEALNRELKYRRRVYDRKVTDGSMTRQLADYQIAIFQAILVDYQMKQQEELLL
jgi:hypothetical protein